MIAANFPSPPTDAARQACVAFIVALPYLVPCRHCGWDLGEFIKRNIENRTVVDPKCFGISNETQDFTALRIAGARMHVDVQADLVLRPRAQ
eukprot:scaffold28965_cov65-Phaeocystis_antarctica.AAC.2